jgi:hypothetical protein
MPSVAWSDARGGGPRLFSLIFLVDASLRWGSNGEWSGGRVLRFRVVSTRRADAAVYGCFGVLCAGRGLGFGWV